MAKHGRDETQLSRRQHQSRNCNCNCNRYYYDLMDATFAGYHQSLSVRILCLYCMGLNLPNRQIAWELHKKWGQFSDRSILKNQN